MNTTGSTTGYTATAKLLHWLVASLVVVQFVLANLAERAEDADDLVRELALFANHRSVGITILALIIIRLLWRWRNRATVATYGVSRQPLFSVRNPARDAD
ncbi:MAG: cytochrome b/b6 domain-containing protein [Proteobacteria bacterium]|nr:cytochrome b/b6 domain-containing protein [Pseudomonadota bacterium]